MAHRCQSLLFCLTVLVSAGSSGSAQECTARQPYESQPDCQSCDSRRGCKKECGIRIPSFRIGFSVGCDGCESCCRKKDCWLKKCCREKKKPSYWERLEPPEAPLVFSVPAQPVREQAIAVNPRMYAAEPRTKRCQPAGSDRETEMLLLLLLLQQQQRQQQSQAGPAQRTTPSAGVSKSLEERVMKMVEEELSSQISQ